MAEAKRKRSRCLHSKNKNNAKSEVTFKQLIHDLFRGAFTIDSSTPTLRINLNEHTIVILQAKCF
jgi:hypothetical protein